MQQPSRVRCPGVRVDDEDADAALRQFARDVDREGGLADPASLIEKTVNHVFRLSVIGHQPGLIPPAQGTMRK